MEIKIKALKFDAGEKLVAFVEKKVARLSKFFDGVAQEAEVSLEDIKEGKKAKIQINIPGDTLIIERVADTFENAITECVDAMKEKYGANAFRFRSKAVGYRKSAVAFETADGRLLHTETSEDEDVRFTVCSRRSVVECIGFSLFSILHTFLKDMVFFPEFFYFFLTVYKI